MTGLLTKNDRDGDDIIDNDNVLVEFFNKNLYNYNYAWKYERSCAINGYSILYLVHKSDYYIMSDIECSGTYYPLKLLIGEEPTVLTEAPVESTQVQVEQSTAVVVEDSPTVYVESTQVQVEQSTAVIDEDSPTIYVESTQVQEEPSTTQLVEKTPTLYAESTQIQDDMSTDIGTHEYYNLEKCEIVDETSFNQNLCIKCNKVKGYYFLNINSISEAELSGQYIDCVNNENKPSNFYFNSEDEDFRPCYETCGTCDQGGTWD